MKRMIALALACAGLMTACAYQQSGADASHPETPESAVSVSETSSAVPESPSEGTTPFLSPDEYPRMDGSTANMPLMAQVRSEACGIPLEEAEKLTSCSTTPDAWLNLANGKADILLVYEPAEETKSAVEQTGTALDVQPVGRDGLVFIVNESNPVEDLTIQQLKDIYSGKITNWKEVGGNDEEIVAYQRSDTSGSQSLFMKLLMNDTKPMKAPHSLKPDAMGMLIDELAEYNNAGNAIGYSVFYYASYMYSKPGLKFLRVDGVAPSDESIAAQEYPLLNEYYVAIREDEGADSPARILRNWILSEEGKAAARKAGYIPVD